MAMQTTVHDVLFEEEQQVRQPWVWGLMLGTALLAVGGIVWGVQVGKVAAWAWLGWSACMALIGGGAALLLYALRLRVVVDREGLHVRFFPLRINRDIPLDDIVRFEPRTYHPILEYGGWGLRLGWKGWAYNVRGNRGVQLTLRGGRRLLIGSQRADEFAAALHAARS